MFGLHGLLAVFLFEWRRLCTPGRLAGWCALAGFPVIMVALTKYNTHDLPEPLPREFWALFLFALIPMLLTALGTLLWTAPAIAVELELKSWIYLSVRPHGRTAVILGKYLAAVAWVLPAAILSLVLSLLIADTGDNLQIGQAIAKLTALAVPAYAALYLVIGALFPKRSMVVAVGYTLVFELIVSFVPALINRLTIQYRLHGLLSRWAEIPLPENGGAFSAHQLIGSSSSGYLVTSTVGYTLLLLVAAVLIVRAAEFSAAAESDV